MKKRNSGYLKEIKLVLRNLNENRIEKSNCIAALKKYIESLEFIFSIEVKHRIEITFENGEEKNTVNLIDDSSYVFYNLLKFLDSEQISNDEIENYLKISHKFFNSYNVPNPIKLQLLNVENNFLKQIRESYFITGIEVNKSIEIRYNLLKNALEKQCFIDNISVAKELLGQYLSKISHNYVLSGQLLQLKEHLSCTLLEAITTTEKSVVLNNYVLLCSNFNLISESELNLLLEDNEEFLQKEEFEFLKDQISCENSVNLSNFRFAIGSISKESVKNKNLLSIIRFSIPYRVIQEDRAVLENNDETIYFLPISSFWQDPLFETAYRLKLSNKSFIYYSDIDKNCIEYTHVEYRFNGLLLLDKELTPGDYKDIDFSKETARIGREYYPHKDYIIDKLIDNYDELSNIVSIDKKKIDINLFSNFIFQIIDVDKKEILFQELFLLTNPDSNLVANKRFLERMEEFNVKESGIDLWKKLINENILSEKSLKDRVVKSINHLIKESIEKNGGYIYFWNNDRPKSEKECQPYIYSHLKTIFEFSGINISREVVCDNGAVDFFVSYTSADKKLLKICIEMKLAHSANLNHGLNVQLPRYVNGENCNYGIYLVFWFKNDTFTYPPNFNNINELETYLNENKKDKRTEVVVVDCTKPVSPSKS